MESAGVLLAVAAAILLGAMSPGPSFVVVARTAMARSRSQGVLTALGMGIGGSIFALAALAGLQLVLTAVPSVYRALQIAGTAYLLYIAYRLWVTAPKPLDLVSSDEVDQDSKMRVFLLGLGTQLSNPKTAIVYASVFTAALPEQASWAISAVLVSLIFIVEFGWYAVVAIAFSTGRARNAYLRGKTWIDRLAAGAMGALGVKVISDIRPA
jgi:threonine/homoserine/homoserine lactone efflux protein